MSDIKDLIVESVSDDARISMPTWVWRENLIEARGEVRDDILKLIAEMIQHAPMRGDVALIDLKKKIEDTIK